MTTFQRSPRQTSAALPCAALPYAAVPWLCVLPLRVLPWLCVLLTCIVACGDDDGPGTEADRLGVGAVCMMDANCFQSDDDSEPDQICLAFKGGYCGLADCSTSTDCPNGSACILHDDNRNYCFRTCLEKAECNLFRGPDEESNCSSSVEFVDGKQKDAAGNGTKACVPPSSS